MKLGTVNRTQSHHIPQPTTRFVLQYHKSLLVIILSIICLSACSRKIPTIQQDLSIHLPSPGIFSWQIDSDDPLNSNTQFSPQELLACGAFATPSNQVNQRIHTTLAQWRDNIPTLSPNLLTLKHRGHLIIGIDSLKQPFSYLENKPTGLLVKYGQLLNQWLFPHSEPEFTPIHGYKDEAQELTKGTIDIALTPYPLICDQVHTFATSMPFYSSYIALAGFNSTPPTPNSTGEVCMDENPIMSSISTIFYPHLTPIYSPATEYCQVLEQQGRPISIIGLRESIFSFARQSTIRNLTSFFRVYFSVISSKNNLNLIQLINLAEAHINADYTAQNELENSLVMPGTLPNMNNLTQCKYDMNNLKNAIPDNTNLALQIKGIQKNFNLTSAQYLLQECTN